MAKQTEQVDWYVDLSEKLERRETRRKWVILAFCVAVPLVLMGGFLLYMVADQRGWIKWLRGPRVETGPEKEKAPKIKEGPGGPVQVKTLQRSDIRFPQLDSDGLITTVNHYFRETKPEKEEGFTVNRESDGRGTLAAYRLKNLATTDIYDFSNVPVKWIGGEWTITDEGWKKVREELQVKMKLRLGDPRL